MSLAEQALRRHVGAARVVAVEAIPVSLPLRAPARFASGAIHVADNVLVRVHTDVGVTGCAEAQPRPYTYGETQVSIVEAVNGWLGPRLLDLDPLARELAGERCSSLANNHCAKAAVDIALWDVVGQLAGVPCSSLLGGAAQEVAVAYMVSYADPEAMAADALAVHEQHGITTFKVKVGREPQLDIRAVERIRAALPDAELYADANRGWSLPQALEAGDALIALGVSAIEEPLPLADRRGRARLAARWRVPLAGDESCLSLQDVERELADGAAQQVSLKVARTGFTESLRVLAHCTALGVPAVAGSQYEGALGAWASLAFAGASAALCRRPVEAANFLDLAADIVAGPEILGGRIALAGGPGLGVVLDEDALARHRTDR